MSNWKRVQLGAVVDLFDHIRIPLNSRQRAERRGPYPYYGAQGIIDSVDEYLFDGRYLLVPEDGENLNSRKLPIAYFADGKFWVNNHAHILRAKTGVADDVFLKHWLNNSDIRPYVTGSAQPKLSQANLKRMELLLPPIGEQRRIASILGAYDDLIKVNRRRITLVEEMARRLFDEWFVHFHFPGHEGRTMVETPSGLCPEGWRHTELRELCDEVRDSVLPSDIDENTPYVGLEHIPRRSTTLDDSGRADEVTSTKLCFQKGDILFGKIRPYFHKVVFAPFEGVSSSDAIVIRSRSSEWNGLVLSIVSSDGFVAHSVTTSNGTKMPRANWNVLARFSVAIPPERLLKRYNDMVIGWAEFAASLNGACNRLSKSRDLILPRLISGELSVASAERELEAVA